MLKGYILQYWQRYNTFAGGKITQYMHQIVCVYIVVPQQKTTTYCLKPTQVRQNIWWKETFKSPTKST